MKTVKFQINNPELLFSFAPAQEFIHQNNFKLMLELLKLQYKKHGIRQLIRKYLQKLLLTTLKVTTIPVSILMIDTLAVIILICQVVKVMMFAKSKDWKKPGFVQLQTNFLILLFVDIVHSQQDDCVKNYVKNTNVRMRKLKCHVDQKVMKM